MGLGCDLVDYMAQEISRARGPFIGSEIEVNRLRAAVHQGRTLSLVAGLLILAACGGGSTTGGADSGPETSWWA